MDKALTVALLGGLAAALIYATWRPAPALPPPPPRAYTPRTALLADAPVDLERLADAMR